MKELIKVAAKLSQNYYPEILYKLYLLNVPLIFKVIWAVVKLYLDKKTRGKVNMFKKYKIKYLLDEIGNIRNILLFMSINS